MATVPNQNTIKIHRERPQKNFLQLKNENWQNAIKDLQDPYAFVLYIYLASNANGYSLDLSPAHIKEATGMPRSTYYKKIKLLKKKGYVTSEGKATLHFHEVSQKEEESVSLPCEQGNPQQKQTNANLCEGIDFTEQEHSNLQDGLTASQDEQESLSDNIEIDNNRELIYNTNNYRHSNNQHDGFVF